MAASDHDMLIYNRKVAFRLQYLLLILLLINKSQARQLAVHLCAQDKDSEPAYRGACCFPMISIAL